MKKYETDAPVFNDSLDIFETTDRAHADILNKCVIEVFENTIALKNVTGNVDAETDGTLQEQISDLKKVATVEKEGLMPKLSGESNQFLNGNGEWEIPAVKYQEKVTKTDKKAPFELTESNIDASKCYCVYSSGSTTRPELNVYLAKSITFDPDTQYLLCSTPLFSNIIENDLHDNPLSEISDPLNSNNYGGYRLYILTNDGNQLACFDTKSGSSSTVVTKFSDLNDFYGKVEDNLYATNGSDTFVATDLSEIVGNYLISSTEILVPYSAGYLFENSEGGMIDFLLSCANNNNALTTRFVKFGVTTSPYAGLGQNITLKPNTKYKYSACVKVLSGAVDVSGFCVTNSSGATMGIAGVELPIVNGKVSYEFTTPSDLSNFKRCYVYNGKINQTTSRQCLLTNMILKEI